MLEYELAIGLADEIEVVEDPNDSDELVIRVQQKAFDDPDRYLRFTHPSRGDRGAAIDTLMKALTRLRDHQPNAPH